MKNDKKFRLYEKMTKNLEPYDGTIYLACCIAVEYDCDIIEHFIKYYKKLGIDEFLVILNTVVDNSENLKLAQKILRKNNIEEKILWRDEYCPYKHTQMLMDMIEENVGNDEWVLTIDIDEFHEYPCDLRKLISYLEKNKFETVEGVLVDRLASSGKVININEDTDLFKVFPLKVNLTMGVLRLTQKVGKTMLHKSHIKLETGQHSITNRKRYHVFPQKLNVYHFKWRGLVMDKQQLLANNYKRRGFNFGDHYQLMVDYYNENRSYIASADDK